MATAQDVPRRPQRADARRNIDAIRTAAKEVFATTGVDAPVREIATRAGVGMGTIYRHYPLRSDLIAAVFRHEVDAAAAMSAELAAQCAPLEAIWRWMEHYVDFVTTKRGLAAALHSGDPAFAGLPAYFEQHLAPAVDDLLRAAADTGEIRNDVEAGELLTAVARLCEPAGPPRTTRSGQERRMIALLLDGLRHREGRRGVHWPARRPG